LLKACTFIFYWHQSRTGHKLKAYSSESITLDVLQSLDFFKSVCSSQLDESRVCVETTTVCRSCTPCVNMYYVIDSVPIGESDMPSRQSRAIRVYAPRPVYQHALRWCSWRQNWLNLECL